MDEKTRGILSFLARMIVRQANNNVIPVPDMDRLKRISDGTAFKDEQDERKESGAVLDLNGSLHRIPVLINGTAYLAYVSAITQEKTGSIAGTDLFVTKIELTAPYVPFISRK
jgi:hypothetical protein